ncbi:hypothetical protein B0I35DRAFT_474646 [Stachybotrys elegans]|uniref:Transcription factor TFIIIC triple barrel domain-containing protein n=1 Tax=Stachybotrys elegans TaxID=80388 RepID=A0A8K0WUS4_9HYPO|nr:hypothetical protein B0I35DRAFT_474646 [Stachybotrys elegans]
MENFDRLDILQPDQGGALALEEILRQVAKDEQEEWEYEYSTTETETYYLTLELSYPEFKERVARTPHHSRGGYYNWLHHVPVTHAQMSQQRRENRDVVDEEDDEEPVPEPDDDAPEIDPRLLSESIEMRKNKGKGKEVVATDPIPTNVSTGGSGDGNTGDNEKADATEENTAPEELRDLQILDLHTQKPVIAYRGRIFEGQWAEMIGTDMILAHHEDEATDKLPALRRLPGGVDLLGASASRILTKEKVLKSKNPEVDTLAPIREEWNIRIPRGKHKTGDKARQTRFLENLMALKKKKGETDHVTIYAKDGAGKNFKDTVGPDSMPRRRKPGAETAPRRERRRIGRPRGRGRGRGRVRVPVEEMMFSGIGPSTVGPGLSTPTPMHWEDLAGGRDEARRFGDERGPDTDQYDDEDEEPMGDSHTDSDENSDEDNLDEMDDEDRSDRDITMTS